MNKYDVVHVTTRHATMSDEELLDIYHRAWDLYYSAEHVETVLRRAQSWGYDPHNMMMKLLLFHAVPRLERVHPLEGGLFRRKVRRDRRPGMPLEGRCAFYGRYAWDILSKHVRFAGMYLQYRRALKRVVRDRTHYMDIATTPVQQEEELETLQMYSATRGAQPVVERQRRRFAARAEAARAEHD
jgi:hypothetical protein